MHRKLPIFALALLGACAGSGAAPKTAPAPAVSSPPRNSGPQHAVEPSTQVVVSAGSQAKTRDSSVSEADVSRRSAEIFGESAAPAAVDSSMDGGPSWDIEVRSYESADRVEHYVRRFTGPARDYFVSRMERGTRYEPMIREQFREGGLPEDMYYLGFVESGYDPHAYSRAAAVGMWQFMTATARGMGMRVDWWIDERRDPVRATAGAVRFLRGLRQQFGSMYLAAAAYNGGPGRIARGLSRYADDLEGTSGEDLFFALAEKDYLKNETREYVPQLIAAALIAKDPERYGIEIRTLPPLAYDSVKVGPTTPLAAIARAAGATVKEIQELNPQILRGMTPPRVSMQVRVPVGSAASFDSAIAALPKEALVPYTKTVSKKGERLPDLAWRTKASAKVLRAFNPNIEISKKTGRLVTGQTILVPSPAVAAAALTVPDPAIEKYPTSKRYHVVKRGESLGLIARRYKTTTKALMRMNGLKRDMIFAGQSLLVRR